MRIAVVAQNIVYGDGQGRINLEIVRHALKLGHQVTVVSVVIDPEVTAAGCGVGTGACPRNPSWRALHSFLKSQSNHRPSSALKKKIDFVIANGYTLTREHDLNLAQFVHTACVNLGMNAQAEAGWIRKGLPDFLQPVHTPFTNGGAIARQRSSSPRRSARLKRFASLESLSQSCGRFPTESTRRNFPPVHANPKQLGCLEGVPVALFAGDIRTNRKGLGSVLEALVKVPGVHLAVVGRSDGSPFVAMAQSLGLADRVHFLASEKTCLPSCAAAICSYFLRATNRLVLW